MKMMMITTIPGTRIKAPIAIREICHPSRLGNLQAIKQEREKSDITY